MRKAFFAAAILLILGSCTSIDKDLNGIFNNRDGRMHRFYATTEQNTQETKVYADENFKVLWNAGDLITIFNQLTYNSKFVFKGEDGDNAGDFEDVTPSGMHSGNTLDNIYAVYPYASGNKINNAGNTITLTLPAEQQYKAHSFGIGANTMVAVTDNSYLAFKNLGGYLQLRLYGDSIYVSSIKIQGNNGEKIAGKANVAVGLGVMPTVAMDGTATDAITLVCEPPVLLGTTAEKYTDFWFVIPPTTFSNGFTITVTDNHGGTYEKSTTKSLTIARSTMEWMSALEVAPETANVNVNPAEHVADVVDLGLSVKWASWNVGATKIGDYGQLYGMGDPSGLLTSTNSADYYYGTSSICGTEYDLAHVMWGGNWRLPTTEELNELYNLCSWSETVVDGVNGALVTGPNGTTLFLPYAGNRQGTYYYERGQQGHYWTGDPYSSVHSHGYYDIDISDGRVHQRDGCSNWIGQSIRPVYDENAKNLSETGTSNCYIAPQNGYFKFNATVKGNSELSVGNPTSVSLLWESYNTDVIPQKNDVIVDVALQNGFVFFHTGHYEGNALIAVKDSVGTILWSWHIWVTDYNPDAEYDIYNGFEGTKVMNRNLGALSNSRDDRSVGLIYEWGRKDPFPGCLTSSKTTIETTAEIEMVETSTTVGTELFAIQNPTKYIIANSQGRESLQTRNSNAWSSSKTMNDPCPVGWRVPDGGEQGLWKNFNNTSTWTFDTVHYGIVFGTDVANSEVWLPAQGYWADSNTYHTGWWRVGVEGRYWTVNTMEDCYSDYFSFFIDDDPNPYVSNNWGIHCSRANGLAVRCCQE